MQIVDIPHDGVFLYVVMGSVSWRLEGGFEFIFVHIKIL